MFLSVSVLIGKNEIVGVSEVWNEMRSVSSAFLQIFFFFLSKKNALMIDNSRNNCPDLHGYP